MKAYRHQTSFPVDMHFVLFSITFQQKVKQPAEKRSKIAQIRMEMYMKISPTKAAVTIKNRHDSDKRYFF
jgi:hypothetical protein